MGAKGRELVYVILFQAAFTALVGYGLGIGLAALLITAAKLRLPEYTSRVTYMNLGLAFYLVQRNRHVLRGRQAREEVIVRQTPEIAAVDFYGTRIRSQNSGEHTESGNVVNAIFAEAAYEAEIDATQQILGFLKEQERITGAQAEAGVVAYSNLLSIQTELATTEATLPPLRQQLAHTRHLLATLVGQPTGDWAPPRVTFSGLTLPYDVPVSLPSDLVRQRPDILVAEAQLHVASAQIGVATAALFPSFSLNANYGLNSTSLSTLFGSSAAFWTLGASLATPVIQGPTLWYQRKAAIDAYQQALANYRQTVLAAFAQVADAIDALQHDAQTVKAQSQALRAAAEALHLIEANYQAGTVNYLQVLIADYQFQQAQLGYIRAMGQRFQDTGALLVALGGGW